MQIPFLPLSLGPSAALQEEPCLHICRAPGKVRPREERYLVSASGKAWYRAFPRAGGGAWPDGVLPAMNSLRRIGLKLEASSGPGSPR